MSEKVGFYLVKTFSIFLISIYYFIFGGAMSITLNKLMREMTDEELKREKTINLVLDIIISFGLIGLGFNGIRLIVKNIPFVFEGWYGYQHSRLKEAAGGIIVGTVIYVFQKKLFKKLTELKRRVDENL